MRLVSMTGAMLMSVFEGFSDAAKVAIEAAHRHSHRLGAVATGPEHLLLGVLTTTSGVAVFFAELGVTPGRVESFIFGIAEAVPVKERGDQWSPAARRALEMSLRERLALEDFVIDVEHLALALINENCDETARIMRELPASPPDLRRGLLVRLGHRGTEPAPDWPGRARSSLESNSGACATPDEVALRGFAPKDQAHIVNLRYEQADHAIVQVGFPGGGPCYILNIYLHDDGWRLERPDGPTR
jgi:ATP-dependent Clp protease ATP-binding subunit ClpC